MGGKLFPRAMSGELARPSIESPGVHTALSMAGMLVPSGMGTQKLMLPPKRSRKWLTYEVCGIFDTYVVGVGVVVVVVVVLVVVGNTMLLVEDVRLLEVVVL